MKLIYTILTLIFVVTAVGVNTAHIHNPQKIRVTKMVLIPGGYYKLLFKQEGEPAKELIKSFFIDVHAVTNNQFLEFVKANPVWRRSKVKRIFADKSYLRKWKDDLHVGDKVNRDAPVTDVSWFAAKAYCDWLGLRLPTVYEWEFVAAADVSKSDGRGDNKFYEKQIAWYSEKSPEKFPDVETCGKNIWGVYDMSGLIREWTFDFNNTNINGPAICGGAAADATDLTNYPAFIRYGFRSSLKANYSLDNLGFRCAKDVGD